MRRRALGIMVAMATVGGVLATLPSLVAKDEPTAQAQAARSVAAGENLARRPGVVATQWPQTTESFVRPASRAIDGNTDGNFNNNSVSHTGTTTTPPHNPYLDIDLGAAYPIERIVVWNRTDGATNRLRDFSVIVSERPIGGQITNFNLNLDGVWHTNIIDRVPNPSLEVPVNATGRYVRIHQRRNLHLHLAEVEVIAAGMPEAGLPEEALPAGLYNRSESLPFSVTDIATTGEQFFSADLAEVWALANVGPTMFVGGRFLNVRNNLTGEKTSQPYLAAFDAATGDFKADWRPRFSGGVSELLALADGRLLAVGSFRSVNGSTVNQGVVILDPVTGAVDPSFRVRVAGGSAAVIDVDVQDGWVYLGGGFTTVSGGPGGGSTSTGFTNLARVRLSDGTPDAVWKPRITEARGTTTLNGTNVITRGTTVTGIDASDRGDRVYVSGFFGSIDNDTGAGYHAWLNTTDGRLIPNLPAHRPSSGEAHQWDVLEVGNRVIKAGTQHETFSTDRTTKQVNGVHGAFCLLNQRSCGGDLQHVSVHNGWIYATCHCLGSTLFWNTSIIDWQAARSNGANPNGAWQPLNGVFRLDPATYRPDPSFTPEIWYSAGTRGAGQGGWAVDMDDDKCLWVGGDVREVRQRGSGKRVSQNGFTKLCSVDDVVPPTPTGFAAGWESEGAATLTWKWMQDDRPGRVYEILRNGVIIAQTTEQRFTDTGAQSGDVYAVRARDRRGNRSATSAPVNIGERLQPLVARLAAGSNWRYVTTTPAPEWTTPEFNVGEWNVATTEAGWGDGDEATVIPGRPLVTYFRTTLDIPADRAAGSAELRYVRDDGIAISINGVEVVRDNLPAGPLTSSTAAVDFIFGAAESAWNTVQVPTSALRAGTNVITAQLHQTTVGNGDASFNLEFVVRGGGASTAITAPPTAIAGESVTLSATTSMLGVERVEFRRDDAVVGTATTAPYSVAWRAEPGAHTFTAVAIGGGGSLASAPVEVSVGCGTDQRVENGACVALPEADVFAANPDGTLVQHRIHTEGRHGGTTVIPAPPVSRVDASTAADGRTWLSAITTDGRWIVASRRASGSFGAWVDLGTGFRDTGIVAVPDTVVSAALRTDGQTFVRELRVDGTWSPALQLHSNITALSLAETLDATPRASLWGVGANGATFQRIRTGSGAWTTWAQIQGGVIRDVASATYAGVNNLVGVGGDGNVCIALNNGGWRNWQCQGVLGATNATVGRADHLYYAATWPDGIRLARRNPNGGWGAATPFAGTAVDVAMAPVVSCAPDRVVREATCASEQVGNLLRVRNGRLIDTPVYRDLVAGPESDLAGGVSRVDVARASNGDLWLATIGTGGEWRVAVRGVRSDSLSSWVTLGTGYKDVGISVTTGGLVTAFGLNNNGSVQVRERNADGTWGPAVDLGGNVTAIDGMLNALGTVPKVMAVGTNGFLYQRDRSGPGTWWAWGQVKDGWSSDVGGLSWMNAAGNGFHEVHVTGGSGSMWRTWWNGNWSAWNQVAGSTNGWTSVSSAWLHNPAAVYGGPNGTSITLLTPGSGWSPVGTFVPGATTDVALA